MIHGKLVSSSVKMADEERSETAAFILTQLPHIVWVRNCHLRHRAGGAALADDDYWPPDEHSHSPFRRRMSEQLESR